jgi:dephospho-CoA kinase
MCTSARRGRLVVVGLVGGVASGKTEVAGMLAEHGAEVIDADAEAHKALAEPEVAGEIRAVWGEEVFGPDGQVDRRALGRLVFEDAESLARLEGIVHPRVEEAIVRRIDAAGRLGGPRMVVIDAPLLLEAGLDRLCDHLIYVEADDERRRELARTTRGWNVRELELRERRQIPLRKKKTRADTTIDNRGTLEETRAQVENLLSRLLPPESSFPRSQQPGVGSS